MSAPIHYSLYENNFWLSPQRLMFWEEEKALIVADLHFGKTGHFRKSGIGIPQNVFKEDIQRLIDQITYFNPQQLIIAGDLFHSIANKEMELFAKWRNDFASLDFHLIKGNHDILAPSFYTETNIIVHPQEMIVNHFRFVHDIQSTESLDNKQYYSFTGHVHPGIKLSGIAKQSLRFPCFYFGDQHAVLPAFSRFTGLHLITPRKRENAFAVVNDSVLKIQ